MRHIGQTGDTLTITCFVHPTKLFILSSRLLTDAVRWSLYNPRCEDISLKMPLNGLAGSCAVVYIPRVGMPCRRAGRRPSPWSIAGWSFVEADAAVPHA